MVATADFEAARPQLTAVAFRMLGSIHDAEDAVQTTWLRARAVDSAAVDNSAAWLTTVLTRVCLDHLRARGRRRETALAAEMIPDQAVAADEQYLRRENVSRALMVLLGCLPPAQRVAYVLHDLFGISFRDIAHTLDTTVGSAKQHASRARRRLERVSPNTEATADAVVVDAFLAAAAGGEMDRMIALMADDCERVVDPALVPPGTAAVLRGARVVAEETGRFVDRIRTSVAMIVNGRPAYVIAPGGHPLAVLEIVTNLGRVSRISITRASGAAASGIRPALPG